MIHIINFSDTEFVVQTLEVEIIGVFDNLEDAKDEALKHVDESEIQEMPYYEVEAE